WARLRRYREEGGTLVITSHYLAEIEALASRVLVVDHGRVIADGTVREITEKVQLRRVLVRSAVTDQLLLDLPEVVSVAPDNSGEQRVLTTRDADVTVRALVTSGLDFRDLQVHGASLEEAFLALTTQPATAAPTTSNAA
ncbi:MAG TPA: ABC transporter ATP-binding protein, partial [Phycicoccus sp.]|nr:ABC transporter ATP-binding protein [Phycicoccus sp.]HRA45205.1 ABC transporter ATP-binding protein [Phycicoccus sp.]